MPAPRSIPLTVLPLGEQRYGCHGCGDCCRDFTVQLRERDLERLRAQGWDRELGEVTVEFRGRRYLRQREDGGCVFLRADGKCRIHAEHGFAAKPVACQLFPFTFAPDARSAKVGISFACASVLANRGPGRASHLGELRRMAGEIDELAPSRTLLDARTEATPEEADAAADVLDRWLSDSAVPFAFRIDGVAWLGQQLAGATFAKVRGARLRELLETLVGALPEVVPPAQRDAIATALVRSKLDRALRGLAPLLLKGPMPERLRLLRQMEPVQRVAPVSAARVQLVRGDGDLETAAVAWRQLCVEKHEQGKGLAVDVLERIVGEPRPAVAAELVGGLARCGDSDLYPVLLRYGSVGGDVVRRACC